MASPLSTPHQNSSTPTSRLIKPKKRICPSLSCSTRANMRRQAPGLKKGSRPFEDQHQRQRAQQQFSHGSRQPRARGGAAAESISGARGRLATAHGLEELAVGVDHHHVALVAEVAR
jgi:hypothetical protein